MLSADEFFPTAVNVCVMLAAAIGGSRLVWLFLSPIPKTLETVQRQRLLTTGRFAPLLILFGCASVVGFVAIVLWLKMAPHGWWNIFPFLVAYALGFIGAIALLAGITVQSVLVDANRGFALEADTGNLQRNVDAAFLLAFSVAALAAMGFHWLPRLDLSTAMLAEIERHEAVIRVPIYMVSFAAIIRTYYALRTGASTTGKEIAVLATWGVSASSIIFGAFIRSILPRDYEIERFLRDRGDPVSLFGVDIFSPPPDIWPDIWRGEILATLSLSLIVIMCATTLVDLVARRGMSSIHVPQRSWPGLLFAGLALSSTGLFAKYDWPQDVPFNWIGEVAVPLAAGMALVRAFPALWAMGAKGYGYAAKTAARGLLAQILILLLLAPLVAATLYVASLLSANGFAVFLVGGMSAAALGWLRPPAAAPDAETVPAASQ